MLRFALPPLVILIYSDVAYVAYFNSFYMDAASLVFLLLTVSLAIAAVLRPSPWVALAFGISAVFFVTSKAQHALLGPMISVLALWLGLRMRDRRSRGIWIASGVAAIVATGVMFSQTTAEYKAGTLYNLIFYRLTTRSSNPAGTLAELGLPPAELSWVGTHAYSPNAPVTNGPWQEEFLHRTSYLRIGIYYLRHPLFTSAVLWEALRVDTPGIRPGNIGNYREKDGYAPYTLAQSFDLWSNLRSKLIASFPFHVIALYLAVIAGCIWCFFRPVLAAEWPAYPVVLVLALCGVVEFLGSVLLDCLETGRHLFLFHAITEMLIISFVAAAVLKFGSVLRPAQPK